jgi:hypothetical protein
MTTTKTRVEVQAETPWYVTVNSKLSLPLAVIIGSWPLVWLFAGLKAYFTARFPPAFVVFLSLGWVPAAMASFTLSALSSRFYERLMQRASAELHSNIAAIAMRIDDDMRERLDLPPATPRTLQ